MADPTLGTPGAPSTSSGNTSTQTVRSLASTVVGTLNLIPLMVSPLANTTDPGLLAVDGVTISATPGAVSSNGWVSGFSVWDTGSPGPRLTFIGKVYAAGDPASVTLGWASPGNHAGGAVSVAAGTFDTSAATSWLDAAAAQAQSASSTSFPTPSLQAPHRSRLIALYGNRTGGGPWTDTQGTLVTSAQSASSANFGLFDEGMVDPGTYTRTGVWTAATSVGVAGLVAIRAAATATPPPSRSTPVAAFLAAQPFHVAHRGGFSIPGGWPEMTIFAYDQAHFRGVTAFEVSTWLSASNTWWNLHDRSTAASRGTGVPTWCTTDVDVPTSTDAQIAAVRTTVGNQPLCTLADLLTKYGQDHIFFIENKRNTNIVAFCDVLQTFPNAIDRFVVKASITALQTAQEWRNRGGQTWGYVDASDVDAGNLTATSAAPFTVLGMDYRANQSYHDQVASYGRIRMGHIVDSAAAKATALGYGDQGMMLADVVSVLPYAGKPVNPEALLA